ncbi:hypothetical protein XELAEV_18032506mg [Xenopus laevis]|uniref:Uncharacterized protein n=1 Tax=Xenopus laevis TaxID=8355 RepID=A0A974CS11_XENLA|nr:hypothetical protein XELAEV_18032506mg [Xenopus laevis]
MPLVPMSGSYGEEANWSQVEATGHCPVCVRDYFTGPVYICTQLTETVREIGLRLSRWEAQSTEVAVKCTESEADSKAMDVEPVVSGEAPPPYTSAAEVIKTEHPPTVQAVLDKVDTWLQPSSEQSEEAPWVEDWEMEYLGPHQHQLRCRNQWYRCQPRRFNLSSLVAASVGTKSSIPWSPDYLMVHDKSSFWVLPGRAAQKDFQAISKVQRKINLEVNKCWGFYMPYAPSYIYDEIETQFNWGCLN